MKTGRLRPSLSDVALHAGVSAATVSRVLNGSAQVQESIRVRVLAALSAVGYEPRSSPRARTSLLKDAVVLLVSDILNPFFAEIARGVEDEAKAGSSLTVVFDTAEDSQREERFLRLLTRQPVEGVIISGSRLQPEQLIAIRGQCRIPMVVVNHGIRHAEIPSVTVDFENATSRATRHLLDLGHTRIAYIAGPSAEVSRARRRGVEVALAEAGLAMRPEWNVSSLPNEGGGFMAMSSLLALPPTDRPTAVVVYNDIMALGVLRALRAHHLRVPEDMSVVGFDDIAIAAHTNPPLTTIAQPKYRMGRMAMQLLRRLNEGQPPSGEGYTLMESPLVVRESTGPVSVRPERSEDGS